MRAKAVVICCCCLFSCAAPTRIASEPAGARCYVEGSFVGYTPIDLHLPSAHRNIRLERDGYVSIDARLRRRFDPVSLAIFPLMIIPRVSTKLEAGYLITLQVGCGNEYRSDVEGLRD